MKMVKIAFALSLFVIINTQIYAEEGFANQLGSSLRDTLGSFKDGFVKKGEERESLQVQFANNPDLANLTINSAKESDFLEVGLNNGITCYIKSKKPFNGKLIAKAYDKEGKEVGYSEQIVFIDENKGKEIVFDFQRTLKTSLVEKYVIDYQKADIAVDVSPKIEKDLGVRFIRVDVPSNNQLIVYAYADKKINSRLVAKAFDKEGKEVNRDAKTILLEDNSTKEIIFNFKDVSKVARYSIEIAEKLAKPIELSDSIKSAGLSITRNDEKSEYNNYQIVSYVIADEDFTGRMIAKALDAHNSEIGRGVVNLDLNEDDAEEIIFNFPKGMNVGKVAKIIIEAKVKK